MQTDKIEWVLKNWRFCLDVNAGFIPQGVRPLISPRMQKTFLEAHAAINTMDDRERKELVMAHVTFNPEHPSVSRFTYERAKKNLAARLGL